MLLCLAGLSSPCWAKRLPSASAKANVSAQPKPSEKAVPESSDESLALLRIGYLKLNLEPAVSPNFDPVPIDRGLPGARLGIDDVNTTGRFMHQAFRLEERVAAGEAELQQALERLAAEGIRFVLIDVPAETLIRFVALPQTASMLFLDVGNRDDRLRGADCSPRVLHTLPSRAMLADALAQYLAKKRWSEWFLVVGPEAEDSLYAGALERAAKRFGGKIVERKAWQYSAEDRRTPQSEIPVFTQGVDYDVLVVADEQGLFGDELLYRTWEARPVVGTQGLVPTAWHPTHEAWGALQLQNRFRDAAKRWMTEIDYGAWLGIRAIGEAATRTRSIEFDAIRDYLRGSEFNLAGFKGVPLSFRTWDGQLRQPVLLAQPRSLVSVAPIEGFIHPKNELDTLGYDESESNCRPSR